MLSLESELAAQLRAHDWQSVTSLVAVSGGADSVALVRGLFRLRKTNATGRLIVVHFNHKLRGQDSNDDAEFVAALARSLDLPAVLGSAEPTALQPAGDGLEAVARDARYSFFKATANEQGARYLFTAHTANDQAETILHRILRGTGLDGLAGIPRVRTMSELTTIVRPLLGIERRDVLAYLESLGASYRDDRSNTDLRFTRNRIRHETLPQLAAVFNTQLSDALIRLGQLAAEAQACIEKQVSVLEQTCVRTAPGEVRVNCTALSADETYLVRQLFVELWQQQGWPLQQMTFEKWQQLAELALSFEENGYLNLPGNVRAVKAHHELILDRDNQAG